MAASMTTPPESPQAVAGSDATPLLSIVIPTLNEAKTLPLLAADLVAQREITLEVLVGDGGSSDATQSVVEAAGWRFVAAPRGRGAQMNAAARLARGDLLLFLHADSRLPDSLLLGRAVAELIEPEQNLFSCDGRRFDLLLQDAGFQLFTLLFQFLHPRLGGRRQDALLDGRHQIVDAPLHLFPEAL